MNYKKTEKEDFLGLTQDIIASSFIAVSVFLGVSSVMVACTLKIYDQKHYLLLEIVYFSPELATVNS